MFSRNTQAPISHAFELEKARVVCIAYDLVLWQAKIECYTVFARERKALVRFSHTLYNRRITIIATLSVNCPFFFLF